jgi:hypothetical protein
MKWVEHKANPDSLPGPDFKAMNKLAAVNEVGRAQVKPVVTHSSKAPGFKLERAWFQA